MNSTNIISIFILAVCWLGISGKPANNARSRCPNVKMLDSLGEIFNRRRLQLEELYCKQRLNIDGTPRAKCTPVVCLASSDYQTIWQLGDKDKRLSVEVEMLKKVVRNVRQLQHQIGKDGSSLVRVLRNQIQDDIMAVEDVLQECYQPDPKGQSLIKKAMGGDFITFPLSKERATACSSGGQWQQLTFMADVIQLYNDMYDSIVDFKSQ